MPTGERPPSQFERSTEASKNNKSAKNNPKDVIIITEKPGETCKSDNLEELDEICEALQGIKQRSNEREELVAKLAKVIQRMKKEREEEAKCKNSQLDQLTGMFQTIMEGVKEVNVAVKEVNVAVKEVNITVNSTKTYAQAAATPPTPICHHATPTNRNKSNTDNKKKQREKLAITITATAAPDTTKNQLKTMHAKDLIHKCQSAIAERFKEGRIPKIHGINKLSNDEYRFHCESEEDPQLLSKMDWSQLFNGVRVKKRKYGLVIHGVPKKDLDPNTENEIILKDEIEEENTSRDLQVVQVNPLRRTQKHLNKIAAHHSVVIFTHSVEEADECIKRGMFIKEDSTIQRSTHPNLTSHSVTSATNSGIWQSTAKTNRNVEIVETKTMTQQAAPTTRNAQDAETHTQHGTSNAANEMKKEAD